MFFLLIIFIPFLLLRRILNSRRAAIRSQFQLERDSSKLIAFFHPFCNAGGGGERVLWSAIKSLHSQYPDHCYVIYSDNYNIESSQILSKARDTFQLDLDRIPVHFVKLRCCCLLSPKLYPMFTLLGQNLGSMILGLEALFRCPPDVLVDTMGASFIYPLFRLLGGSKVSAYVHYPVISVDMLNVVAANVSTFNNQQFIAQSAILTKLKLLYYRIFSQLYKLTGKCAHVVMVNSTWTKNHITEIWKRNVVTVYPPCNTDQLKRLKLTDKTSNIISICQFRPEKNHQLQLESIAKLLELIKENGSDLKPVLVLVGSCRNEEDEERVQQLKRMCSDLGIDQSVQFKVNIDYREMVRLMEEASVAIHTMVNEHFGISVVEFLAAGLLTLTHNSGGPKLDIIDENQTGFLASDCQQFAEILFRLLNMSESESLKIRERARNSIERFSQETFEKAFGEHMKPLV